MPALNTRYEFALPRGYVDGQGRVHRTGTMRLATARDELDPLRDPTVTGPDDPRLTILVLARVVDRLGDLELVTSHDIENLFAVDLAFLQDFYGVINFGSQEEYDELIRSQQESTLLGDPGGAGTPATPLTVPAPDDLSGVDWSDSDDGATGESPAPVRAAVEELRRSTL
jgi:hypothetical protein